MSDKPQSNASQAPKTENGELNEQDLEQASGGVAAQWGDIKGGSTDDKHKDWSEITG